MQCTIRQRRHLECNSLRHADPMKTDEREGDVITTSQVESEPCCGILDRLEVLDVSDRQVDQETIAIVQSAEDECSRFYTAHRVPQLTDHATFDTCSESPHPCSACVNADCCRTRRTAARQVASMCTTSNTRFLVPSAEKLRLDRSSHLFRVHVHRTHHTT